VLVYGVRLQDLGASCACGDVRADLPPPPPGYRTDVVGLPVAAASGYQLLLDDRYPANWPASCGRAGAGARLRRGVTRCVRAGGRGGHRVGLAALWLLGVH